MCDLENSTCISMCLPLSIGVVLAIPHMCVRIVATIFEAVGAEGRVVPRALECKTALEICEAW